jgi:hypothetical protein
MLKKVVAYCDNFQFTEGQFRLKANQQWEGGAKLRVAAMKKPINKRLSADPGWFIYIPSVNDVDETRRIIFDKTYIGDSNFSVMDVIDGLKTFKLRRGLKKKVTFYAKCKKGLDTGVLCDKDTAMRDCVEKMEPGESFKNMRVQYGPFSDETGYDVKSPEFMYYAEVSMRVRWYYYFVLYGHNKEQE